MTNPKYGSLEVFYTYPTDVTKSVELLTNVQGVRQFNVGPEVLQDISIKVSSVMVDVYLYVQVETLLNGDVIDRSNYSTFQFFDIDFAVRIFFFDQYISVSVNDRWVYSYAFASIAYQATTEASLQLHGDTTVLEDIRRVELSDGREAVYVDYESTTDNAIQSIIQQRPVLINPHVNRLLSFTYDAEKDTVPASFVQRFEEEVTHPSSLSSDGLVYAEDVGISVDEETAKDVGLITRLYRLSELNTGAEAAASTIQKRAREQRVKRTVVQRLDPRLEVTDVLHLDLVTTSTKRHLDLYLIIEDVRISLRDGESSMTITGRKKSGS